MILVGEVRDLETIRTAIAAAETGHLVFTTVHAGDCVGAVERLVSVFQQGEQDAVRRQLALTLRAAVAQHLLPSCEGGGNPRRVRGQRGAHGQPRGRQPRSRAAARRRSTLSWNPARPPACRRWNRTWPGSGSAAPSPRRPPWPAPGTSASFATAPPSCAASPTAAMATGRSRGHDLTRGGRDLPGHHPDQDRSERGVQHSGPPGRAAADPPHLGQRDGGLRGVRQSQGHRRPPGRGTPHRQTRRCPRPPTPHLLQQIISEVYGVSERPGHGHRTPAAHRPARARRATSTRKMRWGLPRNSSTPPSSARPATSTWTRRGTNCGSATASTACWNCAARCRWPAMPPSSAA